jgi:hypothetical protein
MLNPFFEPRIITRAFLKDEELRAIPLAEHRRAYPKKRTTLRSTCWRNR